MYQHGHIQVQRHVTTAHLAQTMTLLSLTAAELRQQIEAELASNPALELVEERRCPACHRLLPDRGSCPVCSRPQVESSDEPVVFISPREDFYTSAGISSEEMPEDNFTTASEDLPTYVLRQIAAELEPADRRLAAFLLTHLDEDGLLTISLLEVARYHHLPLSAVEHVQRVIQRAEPVGVGSNTPQQALMVQLEILSETCAIPPLAVEIVRDSFDLLSHRQYGELGRQLHASLRVVQQAVRFISDNLNPFPARSHWGDNQATGSAAGLQIYHHPDILISQLNGNSSNRLSVEIIMPLFGTLRVDPLYREAVRDASEEKRDAWRGEMERASLFVKCIQQRNHTILRLMQRITAVQREFILHGEKHLRSVTRVQMARELEVHESTISRAVANKAVQLPNGRIVPLSMFFDRNLNVRTVLREIIETELKPLSDTELMRLLLDRGYDVARRTVAKYRSMEGILPAHLRHPV